MREPSGSSSYHSAEKIVELQLEIYRKFPGVMTSELQFASEARV